MSGRGVLPGKSTRLVVPVRGVWQDVWSQLSYDRSDRTQAAYRSGVAS